MRLETGPIIEQQLLWCHVLWRSDQNTGATQIDFVVKNSSQAKIGQTTDEWQTVFRDIYVFWQILKKYVVRFDVSVKYGLIMSMRDGKRC